MMKRQFAVKEGRLINRTRPPLKTKPLLIGVEGRWYDATSFAPHHPGGDILLEFANQDATAQFLAYHSRAELQRLKQQGTYPFDWKKPGGSAFQGDWMALNEKFDREGRYQTPMHFVYSRFAIILALAAIMMGGISFYGMSSADGGTNALDIQWQRPACLLLSAMGMALIWLQAGYLWHDTMHMHIFHDRKKDLRLNCFVGTIFFGIAGRWSIDEHHEHHVFPNTYVNGLGLSDPQGGDDVWILNRALIPYAFQRAVYSILQFQMIYFVPLIALVGLVPYRAAAILNVSNFSDCSGLVLHWAWTIGAACCFPTWADGVVFYFLSNSLAGIFGIQVFFSHCSKTYIEKNVSKHAGSWAKSQIETNLDILNPVWLDWYYGPTNLHSVHHLFPRMCRVHQRAVYPEVVALCARYGIELDRCNFVEALCRTLRHLGNVGQNYCPKQQCASGKLK